MQLRLAALLCLPFVFLSCSLDDEDSPPPMDEPTTGATPPPGFTFATSNSVDLDITVTLDGVPVQGAIVRLESVRSPLSSGLEYEDLGGTSAFYKASSDVNGAVLGSVDVPTEFGQLDLIVHLPGATGPYTTEDLRTEGGPFAQSSRQTLDRSSINPVTVALTSI